MSLNTATAEEIRAYYESPAVSQSQLKGLLGGLGPFLDRQEKPLDSPALTLGSAVDHILLGPDGGNLDDVFYISDGPGFSEAEMEIVLSLPERVLDREIADAVDSFGWRPTWKIETRVKRVRELHESWHRELAEAGGRKRISPQLSETAHKVALSFLDSGRARRFLDRGMLEAEDVNSLIAYHQLPIHFTYRNMKCKALIDAMTITCNPSTGEPKSIQAVDIKTMSGHVADFPASARKYRYDIQAAWYRMAIEAWVKQEFGRDAEIPFAFFGFIVASTTHIGKPAHFRASHRFLEMGKHGGRGFWDSSNGNQLHPPIKGFDALLDDWEWYAENGWELDRSLARTDDNGFVKLEWEGLK